MRKLGLIALALLALTIGSISMLSFFVSPKSSDYLEVTGTVCLFRVNPDGTETPFGCEHNLVVNDGKGLIANNSFALTGAQQSINVIALGVDGTAVAVTDNRMCNGTTAAANAELSANGLARAVADAGPSSYTMTGQGANVFNVSINKTFTYTGASLTQVARICLLNSTAASPYVGSVLFSDAIINTSVAGTYNLNNNGDTLKVAWFIGVS